MIKLELTVEQVNLILAALSKQPFEVVASVIAEIKKQGDSQVDALQAEEAKKSAAGTK